MTWEKALLEGIEKWDNLAFGDGIGAECSLCDKNRGFYNCLNNGCPIALSMDMDNCRKTPLRTDWLPMRDRHDENNAHPKVQDAAVLEYLFLCMIYHEYYG